MRRLVSRLAGVAAPAAYAVLVALAAGVTLASDCAEASPLAAPAALHAAIDRVALPQQAQFVYLGRPYCWYPYGWAGAGWYWCGYGTRAGLGWGGASGWNGWIAPRNYGAMHVAPGYRFRRYR